MTAADGEAVAARRDHAGPPWDAPGQQVPLAAGNPITNLNELFAFIALEEPGGFAGVHVEDDRFVIQMVEPGRARAGAMRWIRQFYGKQLRGMPVEFRRTDRSFADLMSWYRTFQNVVFKNGGTWTDVQESENQLLAGVPARVSKDRLHRELRARGVPSNIYGFERVGIPQPVGGTLQGKFRPVVGGVKIGCTLGFNVRHWNSGRAFVTNAHCTGRMGVVEGDGHDFYQPNFDTRFDNHIGTEVLDSPFWTGTNSVTGETCPAEHTGGCRYADAALVDYDASVADSLGYVARPECKNCSSVTIDIAEPNFTIIDEFHTAAEGQEVNYVGEETGWETGSITNTCAEVDLDNTKDDDDHYPPGTALLCQVRVDADHENPILGDSGAPVLATFTSSEEVSTRLAGIVWLTQTNGDDFWYSGIGGIRVDLNPNSDLSCNGLETVAGGGCDGPDGDFSECTGDRESFQCESDGGF